MVEPMPSNIFAGRERALKVALASVCVKVVAYLGKQPLFKKGVPISNKECGEVLYLARFMISSAKEAAESDMLMDADSMTLVDSLSRSISIISGRDPDDSDWLVCYEALRESTVSYVSVNEFSAEALEAASAKLVDDIEFY
jgi:hypothetical protein